MTGIISRLEIDVMQVNELAEASEISVKYGIPAIVVHPNLVGDAIFNRLRAKGQYKIIVPIDWPKGELKGQAKFRGINKQALEADGFEIMLAENQKSYQIKEEAKYVTEFITTYLSDFAEIRFVFGNTARTDEQIVEICNGLNGFKTPTLLRNETQLKTQQSKANTDTHLNFINTLRQNGVGAPIKISGNINNLKSTAGLATAHRFAVSVAQGKAIIKEYYAQPSGLKEILT